MSDVLLSPSSPNADLSSSFAPSSPFEAQEISSSQSDRVNGHSAIVSPVALAAPSSAPAAIATPSVASPMNISPSSSPSHIQTATNMAAPYTNGVSSPHSYLNSSASYSVPPPSSSAAASSMSSSFSSSSPSFAPPVAASSSFSAPASAPVSAPVSAPAYAPTSSSSPSSSAPSSSSSTAAASAAAAAAAATAATAALYAELSDFKDLPPIKLATTRDARALYDNLADLFSLLVTTEHVEKAYVKDSISNKDYTAACGKLIAQYKTLKDSLVNEVPDLEAFCREYGLNVKAAENRFKVGVPATILHGDVGKTSSGKELTVFHAVQHFITAMDSLKLNMKAVDELHPNLTDLMDSINKVPNLPVDHEAKTKVRDWLVTLSGMKAHEELTDEQIRQMSFDLDSAYSQFHKFVQGKQ